MRRNYAVALGIFALFVVGASVLFAQSNFSYGVIQSSCAPWDGPAIVVTLSAEPAQCRQTSGPFVDIGVWRGLPIHSGQEVAFGQGSDAGFASRCAKVGDCERAESGRIVFERYDEGSGATGRYELRFKDGKNLSGRFDVKWCENRVVCR